jgi:hypothetical protein
MIPTLFSVSYAGLWGQQTLDLESFIRKAATLGYSAVELMAKRPNLSQPGLGQRGHSSGTGGLTFPDWAACIPGWLGAVVGAGVVQDEPERSGVFLGVVVLILSSLFH